MQKNGLCEYLLHYWITNTNALMYGQHFPLVFGTGGANFKHFIYCWLLEKEHCILRAYVMLCIKRLKVDPSEIW